MSSREHLIENALILYKEAKDGKMTVEEAEKQYRSSEINKDMARQTGIRLDDVLEMAFYVIWGWGNR